MKIKNVCFVTGSRAEYGLLKVLMKKISGDPSMRLQLVVTGAHLSQAHGMTYQEIENDGFYIDEKIPILKEDDLSLARVHSLGEAVGALGEALNRLKPDLVVLLGDRYEIFAAAQAALILKFPIAHIGGGDITEGAFDESLRHSITKMAHWHFPTHEDAAGRLRQMGENPMRIFNVGSLAVDQIQTFDPLSKDELEKELKFRFREKNLLVTFHPVTLGEVSSVVQIHELLSALEALGKEIGIIFTGPNADPEGAALRQMMESYVERNTNAKFYPSLGQKLYWNVMAHADAVIGNSSSGLYEAPSFKKPTVNIGDREKGRLRADSVINCGPQKQAILKAIEEALNKDCSRVINPYGDGKTAAAIFKILKSMDNSTIQIQKHFFNLGLAKPSGRVYVIAEAGVNHNGSVFKAKQLVDSAKNAGADAIKFQTFRANRLATSDALKASYQKRWTDAQESQAEMLKKLELDENAHREILDYCQKVGIEFMSSAFDVEDLKFLTQTLKVKCLKIPSGEITHGPYLIEVGKARLPMIISTGMSTLEEIEEALGAVAFGWLGDNSTSPSRDCFHQVLYSSRFSKELSKKITLLQCTTQYPTPYEDANLLSMDLLGDRFGTLVGLSDHTPGIEVSIAAVARGATVIEKHLTLDKNMSGPDHRASLDPGEFKQLVASIRHVEQAFGKYEKTPRVCELEIRDIARKSLVTAKEIKKGEPFSADNLCLKRPGNGVSPMRYWDLLGHQAERDYKKDEVIRL